MPRLPPVARGVAFNIPLSWLAGVGAGLLAAALWGGGAVVARHLISQQLAPLDLAVLRYAGCFPVALALFASGFGGLPAGLGWWRIALLVVLAGPPYHLLVLSGYQYAGAGGGTLVICGLLPVFALALAAGAGSRFRWCGWQLAGLALIGSGLLLLALAAPALHGTAVLVTPWGVVIFAGAALAWAVLNRLVARWQVDALTLTIMLGLSAPLFLPFYIMLAGGLTLPHVPLHELMLQVVYHGVGIAFGATFLFFFAVQRAGAQSASNLQALAPAFATGLGVALLGEPFTAGTGVAAVAIIAGIAMSIATGSTGLRRVDHDQGRSHVEAP